MNKNGLFQFMQDVAFIVNNGKDIQDKEWHN